MSLARLLRLASLLALLAAPVAFAAEPPKPGDAPEQPSLRDDNEVIAASEKWLGLIDAGKLGPAWDLGAPTLKAQVTRAAWIDGIGAARKPFGKLVSRSRERFARTHQIPGAPDADYAIVEFATTFAGGRHAIEQITWMLDPHGTAGPMGDIWRVSGYYIR